MIINYFKIAFRNLVSQKFYSLINIVGLSIGITACILVALYISQDLRYDRYHQNADRIYRIGFSNTQSGVTNCSAQTPALLGPTLKELYPEIKKISRICFSESALVTIGETKNFEDRIVYADSSFFDIFSFQAVVGNKAQFLKKPNTIILTESTARRYFGKENPLGKMLLINTKYGFEVTGVMKDVPPASHFRFDFIATYASLNEQPVGDYIPQWGATFGSYTYMLAEKGFDPVAFERKTKTFFKTHTDIRNEDWRVVVTPLIKIHLHSHLDDEMEENGSVARIIILSSIALFILLLACINFINLSTARSSRRAIEIGLRKVCGADRFHLIQQFIGESVLLSLVSLLISLVTVILVIPLFSALVGTPMTLEIGQNWVTYLLTLAGVLLVGVMAGAYPAFNFSSYQPVDVIKGVNAGSSNKSGAPFLRKGLVVLQFTISIILIAGTIIVNLQLSHLLHYNMGFDKQHMIVIPAYGRIGDTYKTIRNELKSIPGITSVTAGRGNPVSENLFGADCKPNGIDNNAGSFDIKVNSVDGDYMDHFGVTLVAGRNFSEQFSGDFPASMIVNEKMVKSLGFNNPRDAIGKSYFISINGFKPTIIGVVKDFNSSSLHNEISAQVFMTNPNWYREFIIKVNSTNLSSTLGKVKKTWGKFFQQYPFEYKFLDESIEKMYRSEQQYSHVIILFSFIALFIASMGLFALASFVTGQRKKEIGIRKVQGASVGSIVHLVTGDFMILVLFANIMAWPVAWYFMNKWLTGFPYKISINLWIFIAAGGLAFLVALITVSFQAVMAASANPVKSLKYE